MTFSEKNVAWFKKREQVIRAWEAENPAPTSVIPDSIGGYDIVERADGSGYNVGCKFVSLELLEAAVERLHELKGEKPDLSKRWKVVFNPSSDNITEAPNFGMDKSMEVL